MKKINIVKAKYTVDTNGYKKGKAVMCLDTGEVFTSAKETADVKGFSYSAFVQQLRQNRESEDGKLYCYICDMGYYANAIQSRIARQNQAAYNEAQRQYEIAKARMEALKQNI